MLGEFVAVAYINLFFFLGGMLLQTKCRLMDPILTYL